MKIKFCCDNGANIHSKRTETFSLDHLGVTADEWAQLSEDEKLKMAEEWAWERLEIWFEEVRE